MSESILLELEKARQSGAGYLSWLTKLSEKWNVKKFEDAGQNHRIWGRNWALTRMRHVINKNERFPYPIENHLWSISETGRTIWGDNVPIIDWRARMPGAVRNEELVNRIWTWIVGEVHWDSWWGDLYNLLPQTGVCATKALWDGSAARGGGPRLARIDQRLVTYDNWCRITHRAAGGVEVRYDISVEELKSKYPELASKISSASSSDFEQMQNSRDSLLSGGMNTGFVSQQSQKEASGELVQTWLRLRPVQQPYENYSSETYMDDMPWLCISWIPGAGVVDEEITNNGLQVLSSQLWSNPDSWVGISDFDMVYGLAVANDKLSILDDKLRSRLFAPALRKLRQTRLSITGGDMDPQVWNFDNEREMAATQWVQPPGPNADSLNARASLPEMLRRILGYEDIGPEAYLAKSLTASAVQAAQEALERKPRQKLRNAIPLVVDTASVLLSLVIEHLGADIFVGEGDEGQAISAQQIRDLNASDYIPRSQNMKSGPLTASGRINAYKLLGEFDVFNPESPIPASVRVDLIDLSQVPNSSTIKRELQLDEKARLQLAAEKEMELLASEQGIPGAAGGGAVGTEVPAQAAAPVASVTPEQLDSMWR